jgi:NDP-sugar pyrophosphorylase family protein
MLTPLPKNTTTTSLAASGIKPRQTTGQQVPPLKTTYSPGGEGDVSLLPNGKPGIFHLFYKHKGQTQPIGVLGHVKNQRLTAHITRNGPVVEVQNRETGQRYFIFPGGEYRGESGLQIKLYDQKRRATDTNATTPGDRASFSHPGKPVQTITDQALIPVGGSATRLAPITAVVPKPAFPIASNGQTLIGRVAERLRDNGIHHLIVTTRVMPDLIKGALRQLKHGNPQVTYVQEKQALGDIGSLLNMLKTPELYGLDVNKPLLIVQGDAYTKANFSHLLKAHRKHNAAITFAFKTVPDNQVSQFGIMATDGSHADKVSGHIQHFIEKPDPNDTPHRNANTGIMVLGPELLKQLPDIHQAVGKPTAVNFAVHLMPEVMRRIQAGEIKNDKGQPLTAWAQRLISPWHDVGRPDSYFTVHENRDAKGTVYWPGAKESDQVTVAGNVIAIKD